jgi:hypothetical protein
MGLCYRCGWQVGVSGGGANDSRGLLDEQGLAGDPASGSGGAVASDWFMGYTPWYYPPTCGQGGGVTAVIDLGSPHLISDIYAQHRSGSVVARLSINADSPFDATPAWSTVVNTSQNAKKQPTNPPYVCNGWGWMQPWCGWNISRTGIPGRYITIAALEPCAIGEVVIYGKPASTSGPPPPQPQLAASAPSPPPRLMGQFIGVNSFVTNPLARQNAAGSIREYHDFQWDEGVGDKCFPSEQAKFSPDYSGFDSDGFYNRTFASGIKVHAVLQGRPLCQFADNASTSGFKCVDSNTMLGTAATADPRSYTQLAGHLFQYAARYGRTKVPPSQIRMAPGQPPLTGAGWLEGLEVRNEPNGGWAGREAYSTPYEHAALLSACFDGHEGSLPTPTGIRNADPTMLVSMGGLSGAGYLALSHVKVMKLWFQKNRKDGKFPADILNFHFYCNDDQVSKVGARPAVHTRGRPISTSPFVWPSGFPHKMDPMVLNPHRVHASLQGDSPEECAIEDVARNLTAWRDANEPQMQVWLTEFGCV